MTTVLTLKEHDERVGTVNADNSLNYPRWDILGRDYSHASVANEIRWFIINGERRFVVIPPDAEQPVVVDIYAADLIGSTEVLDSASGIALEPTLEGQGATQGEGVDTSTPDPVENAQIASEVDLGDGDLLDQEIEHFKQMHQEAIDADPNYVPPPEVPEPKHNKLKGKK